MTRARLPFVFKLVLAALAAALLASCESGDDAQLSDNDYAERMATEHAGDTPVASPQAATRPAAPTEASDVTYATVEGEEIAGYLARPKDASEGLPVVLLVHEWWGLNDNIRAITAQLAAEGYAALAVDLYEGEVGADRDTARGLMQAAMGRVPQLEDNLRQAIAYAKDELGAAKIGVIGWCFGGGWSLNTALLAPAEIDAAVIYYGRLKTDAADLEPLAAPVLGIFGEEDKGIPLEMVRAFEATLGELGKPASIHVCPGADHAFANPSGERYQKEAAEDAWAKTLAFFGEHLGG